MTYTATDTTDSITLADDATVDFTFSDATPPTNTITLGSATRAWLTGTTLYYNGAAGGSFTLSSAVADGGAGPPPPPIPAVGAGGLGARRRDGLDPGRRPVRLERVLVRRRLERRLHLRRHRERRLDAAEHEP